MEENSSAAGAVPLLPITERNTRQAIVAEWCAAAFGADAASSLPQRGVRLLEEAIELYQAAGCDAGMAHKLIDFVFARPVGRLSKEIGQVGLVLLSMATAAGVSADAEEVREVARVREKPLEHYAARNKAKNAAGFNTAATVSEGEEQGSRNREEPPSSPSRERVELLEARNLAIDQCEQIAGQVGRQFCSGDGYVMGGPAAIIATICGAMRALKAPSDG